MWRLSTFWRKNGSLGLINCLIEEFDYILLLPSGEAHGAHRTFLYFILIVFGVPVAEELSTLSPTRVYTRLG